MQVSEKQRQIAVEYFRDPPKVLILEGSVRSGKTYLNNALFYFHVRSRADRGLHFIISGHSLGSVKRNVLAPMAETFGVDTKTDPVGSFDMFGNHIHCFGADKADSYRAMVGHTSHGWYANEVNLQHRNSVQEAFNRCSGDDAFILWDCNPDYPEHWAKTDYIDRSGEKLRSGRPWISSHHFTLRDNPFLDPEYVETLVKSTPSGMWFDRFVLGEWVGAEGLVYDIFNPKIHVYNEMHPIPDNWERFRAIDFGYTNPFCCLWGAIDGGRRVFIYDEYYKARTLLADHAAEIKSRGPVSWTVADWDAQGCAELKAEGIFIVSAQKDVSLGIQRVAERLVLADDGFPRLFVSSKCKNLIREFGQYAWAPLADGRPAKEEPIKQSDHALDALRYAVMRADRGRARVSEISASDLGF